MDCCLSLIIFLAERESRRCLHVTASREGERGGREKDGAGYTLFDILTLPPTGGATDQAREGERTEQSEGTILRTDRQPSLFIFHRIACH
jgi:hypothetical protein